MNPSSALAIAASCFSLILAVLVFRQHPRAVLNRWVSLWCLVYCLETWGEALTLSAPDGPAFWALYRVTHVFLALLEPLSVIVPLVFAGIRGAAALGVALPILLTALVESVQIVAGHVFVSGYLPSPWGNVAVPNQDPLWVGVGAMAGLYTALANLVLLVWAWRSHRAPLYQAFLLRYLGLNAFAILVTAVCLYFWATRGVPDVSFVFGLIYSLGMFWLISRYPFLSDQRPRVDTAVLEHLKTAVLVLDARATVVHANQGAETLLGRTMVALEGRTLLDILVGWTGLEELQEALGRDEVPGKPMEGLLGTNRFLLNLTPGRDRFGRILILYAQITPAGFLDGVGQRHGLSPRERQVASLVVEGTGTQEIADLLFISPATVKNHLHKLFQKTGTASRVELMRLLTEEG